MRSLVGNDVVDLGDPEIAEHHTRGRFVARICCAMGSMWVRIRAGLPIFATIIVSITVLPLLCVTVKSSSRYRPSPLRVKP